MTISERDVKPGTKLQLKGYRDSWSDCVYIGVSIKGNAVVEFLATLIGDSEAPVVKWEHLRFPVREVKWWARHYRLDGKAFLPLTTNFLASEECPDHLINGASERMIWLGDPFFVVVDTPLDTPE